MIDNQSHTIVVKKKRCGINCGPKVSLISYETATRTSNVYSFYFFTNKYD